MQNQTNSKLTLLEIVVVITIIAILAIITFVVINPIGRFNIAADNKRKEDVEIILTTVVNYRINNKGNLPKANGTDLPIVTQDNIMNIGTEANKLKGLNLNANLFPLDPNGNQYRVGKLESGILAVGTQLSGGSIFIATR